MFQNEYRKANDSIHAPKELLDVIKAESEEIEFSFSKPAKQRKWPSILGYSSLAVAAAVLAILVIRPFDSGKKTALAASQSNAAAVQETAAEEKAVLAAGFTASDTTGSALFSASAVQDAAVPEARLEKSDGDEDEYYITYNIEEPGYEDIYSMLIPSADLLDSGSNEAKPAELPDSESTSALPGTRNHFRAFDQDFYLLEDRNIREVVLDRDMAFVISQTQKDVFTSVYTKDGLIGETRQSGSYQSYEIKDTTIFEDDYSLSEHHVIVIESTFIPDLSKADKSAPGSYCPSYADSDEDRILFPDEITCLTEGTGFSVYGAVEAAESVQILYIFAELGE